ncbi:MAG: hypothetical protein ABI832_01735 [bacterium]
MPLQNRVLPTGEIVVDPARGQFTGNRGCLHDDHKRLGRARWKGRAWIICALDYKGWQRQVMTPHSWTELFFLDEAVALAAGHRPCALCRRTAYNAYRGAWGGAPSAPEMDRALHQARLTPERGQRRFRAVCADLPDGTFVRHDGRPHLIMAAQLHAYSPAGYVAALAIPAGEVEVMTPGPTVDVLRNGYRPLVALSLGVEMGPRPFA